MQGERYLDPGARARVAGGVGAEPAFQRIVAFAALDCVVTATAVERVVAAEAGQDVRTCTAGQRIRECRAFQVFDIAEGVETFASVLLRVPGDNGDSHPIRCVGVACRIATATALMVIVAGAAAQDVVAVTAIDEIDAGAAIQNIGTLATV